MNKLIKDVSGWIILLCLFSCSTTEKLVNKAIQKDKAKVAQITRETFPCTDTKTDTLIVTDSLYEFVDCPDNDYTPVRIDTVQIDGKTVYVPITKTVRTPVKVQRETKYITVKVEDSAKIFVMTKSLNEITATNEINESKIHKQKKAIRILLIPWILGVLYILYRIFIKKWL